MVDDDEAILAMVERESQVALRKAKLGEQKQAIASLRRAFLIVEDLNGASGYRRPIVRLASASLRLQMCVVLSSVGRHQTAEEQARTAKHEVDEMWRSLEESQSQYNAAVITGDNSKLPAGLRKMLLQPPFWLSRGLEVSVQARMSQAIEMEYSLPLSEISRAETAWAGRRKKELQDDRASGPKVARSLALAAGPRPRPSRGEEVIELYLEALSLAEKLLPAHNSVRAQVAKCWQDARLRWAGGMAEMGTRSAPSFPAVSQLLCSGENAMRSTSSSHSQMSPSQSGWRSQSPRSEAAGDVFYSSLPKASAKPKASNDPSPIDSGTEPIKMAAVVRPGHAETRVDPFADWKKNVMDLGRVDLTQRKLQDYEGIKSLHQDIKAMGRRFKFGVFKELDDDTLHDNRTLYTEHGVKALEKGRQIKDRTRTEASYEQDSRMAQSASLFSSYGIHPLSPGTSMKDHVRLLKESSERLQR